MEIKAAIHNSFSFSVIAKPSYKCEHIELRQITNTIPKLKMNTWFDQLLSTSENVCCGGMREDSWDPRRGLFTQDTQNLPHLHLRSNILCETQRRHYPHKMSRSGERQGTLKHLNRGRRLGEDEELHGNSKIRNQHPMAALRTGE
jgi:hypothetical protein